MRRPPSKELKALATMPIARGAISAGIGAAVAVPAGGVRHKQTLEEEREFHDSPCRAGVARANCHQSPAVSATVSQGTNP